MHAQALRSDPLSCRDRARIPGSRRPHDYRQTGLVRGCGGVAGAAWPIAALDSLQAQRGGDTHDADLLVGTSSGVILAALLGAGIGVDRLLACQRGGTDNDCSWDHNIGMRDKRGAIIGTGASAVQVIPAIAEQVAHLTVFQCTPVWCLPRPDAVLNAGEAVGRAFLRQQVRDPEVRDKLTALQPRLQASDLLQ